MVVWQARGASAPAMASVVKMAAAPVVLVGGGSVRRTRIGEGKPRVESLAVEGIRTERQKVAELR